MHIWAVPCVEEIVAGSGREGEATPEVDLAHPKEDEALKACEDCCWREDTCWYDLPESERHPVKMVKEGT